MSRRLLIALAIAVPLSAQEPAGPTMPATTLDAVLLVPVTGGPALGTSLPSGRFAINRQITNTFGLQAGALHLTPEGAGMWAGFASAKFDLLRGAKLRAAPFVDIGYGRMQATVDAGGVVIGGEYTPRNQTATIMAFGGGAGLGLEYALGAMSLTATAGYWYFPTSEPKAVIDGIASGETVALNGAFAGIGLKFGFGNIPVAVQPGLLPRGEGALRIQIEEPAEWAGTGMRGLRTMPKNSIRVIGTVRDAAGIGVREVRINGQLAALRPLDASGALVRFVGYAGIEEDTEAVEVSARATDGRQASNVYEVTPSQIAARARPAEATGQRFAVVIGVSEYTDDAIPDLEYADDDAQAFYEFLRSERAGLGGLPEENIVLLVDEDATYRNMRSALYTFLQKATDEDVVYVYMAAHGAPDPNRMDDLYVLPFDAESDNIPGTGFPMEDVREAIQKLYARHVVLMTDACHSGGIGMGSVATRAAGGEESLNAINQAFLQDLQATTSGLAILTASEARQLSREGPEWGGHGIFTYYLLKGLQGEADEDGDQLVRLGEVMEYVRDQVRRETSNGQIPSIGSTSYDRYMPMAIVPDEEGEKDAR